MSGLAIAALVISGCATTRPIEAEFSPKIGNSAPAAIPDVSPLTNAMVERDRTLESLQTNAIMEYSSGDTQVKAREEIIVRRPGSLRVEAMSPFGVALIVAAQDSRLQIFEPSKNILMRGAADAATLARFARIPMAPRDAVVMLMGIVPEARNAVLPESVRNEGDLTLLVYHRPDRALRELGFRDGQLAMVRETAVGGTVNFEIRYTDYHDIGGVMFAYQIDANFPGAATHVNILYKRPIINDKIPDSVFTLTPGPDAKQIDIGMTLQSKVRCDA